MRKCPNCRKAIPVGARRCVHCRTLVNDSSGSDPSSTRMGLGARREEAPDFDVNNSTSFGRPGSQESLGGVAKSNERLPDARRFDAAPHHTMIGLGPISGIRRQQNEAPERNFAQTTIAGMPGITFDRNQQGFSSQSATPERLTAVADLGRSADSNERQRTVAPVVAKQSIDAVSFDVPELVPSRAEDPEDALFALPGVVPPPSSLVDEEFVDLTSQLFGADFAIDAFDGDEEDGWDFDFLTPPLHDEASERLIQSIDGHFVSDPSIQPISAASEESLVKAIGAQPSAHHEPIKKESHSKKHVEKDPSLPSSESLQAMVVSRNAVATPLVPLTSSDTNHKSTGRTDTFVISMAMLSGLLSIVWIFIPSLESKTVYSSFVDGPLNLLLVLSASMVAIVDFSSLSFGKKQHSMLMTLIFLGMFILLCALMIIAPVGAWLPQRYILVAAAVGNFVCAIYYFLKQA